MPRVYRKAARIATYACGVSLTAGGLILLPPKEQLPNALLPSRVLLEGVARVSRCAVVGAQIFADYTVNLRGEHDQSQWDTVHTRSARRLVNLAETNGGLYVKAGQIFANMSHILPYQFCHEMAVLQDSVKKKPFSEIVAVLQKDLGQTLDQVFSYIDPEPIAAASLAQVHRARLRKENVEVAVKVQYIDIAQRFRGDMATIDLMLSIAGSLFPGFDLGQIITKLNDTVAAELDFRIEASNCDRAAKDLKKGGFGNRVVCPHLFWDYVTRRVLVSEFVLNSVKISDRAGMEKLGINVSEAATNFFDAIAFQIFTTGFFHGDPHAGNVLVCKAKNGSPQVVLLDFGLCAEMNETQRKEMSDIWTCCTTRNSAKLEEISKRYHCDDYELFASCFLQHPYSFYSLGKGRVMSKEIQESMRNTVKHKMTEVNTIVSSLPKEYTLVLRSIMATKAINCELGDVVNRPIRMLKYSLKTSHEDIPKLKLNYMLAKAWFSELLSRISMSLIKWRSPELAEALEESMHVSG
uniref:Ubiquinone biosynthesis protein n=1 Tax=Angomonas desouzai TaxID=59800 RepID=T1YU53_9TRYP|nr:ubiquinone biosynthesis protein [Angomonas desouzai]